MRRQHTASREARRFGRPAGWVRCTAASASSAPTSAAPHARTRSAPCSTPAAWRSGRNLALAHREYVVAAMPEFLRRHPNHRSSGLRPLPANSRKKERYRWSARWAGQGRLPFAPKPEIGRDRTAEIDHEIELLPAASWSGWPDLNRRPLRPEAISADMPWPGQSRAGGPSSSPAQTL